MKTEDSPETRHNPYKFEYSIPYFLDDIRVNSVRVAKRARKGVAFLGVIENGKFVPKGTGFLVTCRSSVQGQVFLHLVTAQHVIVEIQKTSDIVFTRFNMKGGGVGGARFNVSDWHYHPDTDQFVDVAVIPIRFSDTAEYTYFRIEDDFVSDKVINDTKMDTGDDVFVVGLFSSHYGVGKNVPIVRIGNIAAMPEEPVLTKSGYMDAYLIEGRSIGGLSGSPVFFQPAPIRIIDGEATYLTEGSNDHYLLGLIHGHFDVKEIMDIAQDDAEYAKTNKLHSGIAIVVPSEKIVETINQDELKKMREETVKKAMADSDAVADVAEEKTDISGDQILENMLNTPPETQEEIKDK